MLMSPALAIGLIATLALLLAAASATAGALWWRCRSLPLVRAAALAEELADRQRALEAILARLDPEAQRAGRPSSGTATTTRRADRARGGAGPTLIAVPDLASPSANAGAAAELGRRFGAIWDLADAGASAEAIARGTGQPIGQVELILGLRRHLAAASATGGRS